MLGGTKQAYIWTINGTVWHIVNSLAGTMILAEMYGDGFTSTWEIPESLFDAEFIEAKDLRYISDVLVHQPLSGFSSRLLRSDYAGFSTEAQRASDNAKLNIGFEDSFDFDVPATGAFIAATTGSLRTWYDQFNGNDALETTFSQMPALTSLGGNNNRPAYIYNGTTCKMPANGLAASFSGSDKPFTFLTAYNSSDTATARDLITLGRSSNNTPFISHNWSNTPEQRITRRADAGGSDNINGQATAVNTYFISGVMFDGINMTLILNGNIITPSAANLTAITLNRFTIGALGKIAYSKFWKGNIDEVLIWNQAIGTADLQQASYNMNQFYAIF